MPTDPPLHVPEHSPVTRRGAPALVALALVVLPVLLAVAAAVWTTAFVAFMHVRRVRYARHTNTPLPRRSVLGWLRVWTREIGVLLRVQAWHAWVPWARRPWIPPQSTGHPVLLVHGFTQDGTNFLAMQRRLHARGRITWAMSLGYPPRRVERYVVALSAAIDQAVARFGAPVDVVAHSMGGVVLRAVLARRPDLVAKVGRVVTLGTPHRGTAASRGIRLPETVFLGRRSHALHALPSLPDLVGPGSVTSIGSLDDTTVYPEDTTWAGSETHVTLTGIGHAGLLVVDEALAHVERALDPPMLLAGGPDA